jgi:hypothetical protein
MARLNKGESEEGPRFSLLPEETTSDTVVCTLDWLKETAQIPEGLEQAFDLIMATIQERNRLQEERQVQNKAYEAQIREHEAQIREHEAQVRELIEERDQFQHELLQALRQQATTRETTPQPQTTPIKSTKISDPPLLTDGKSPTFSGWLLKIKNKLKVNADHFADKDAKIAYIQLCTDREASEHIQPRLEEGSADPYQSATDLLEHLQSIYEDPNRVFKAKNKFKKLFIKESDTFYKFYTRFQHLSGKAKIAASDLKYELNNKLSFNLQKQVIVQSYNDNVSLKAFADQYRIVDQSLKAISKRQNRSRPTAGHTPQVPGTQTGSLPSETNLVPCTTQPCTPITDKEKQKLQAENKCYYCKKEGYRFFECPVKARTKLTTVNIVSTEAEEEGQGKESP